MARRYTGQVVQAHRTQNVAATTAVAFDESTAGFHAQGDGTVVATFSNDSSTVSLVVQSGMFYPYSLSSVDASNAVALVALFN